jgi:hypothetical protein
MDTRACEMGGLMQTLSTVLGRSLGKGNESKPTNNYHQIQLLSLFCVREHNTP